MRYFCSVNSQNAIALSVPFDALYSRRGKISELIALNSILGVTLLLPLDTPASPAGICVKRDVEIEHDVPWTVAYKLPS